jgi:hypothetical protein
MDGPYLVEMTTKGEVIWEWRSWEHLDPVNDPITEVQGDRDVWTVANSISEMSDGNIVVSFRDISTVVMINRASSRRSARVLHPRERPPFAVRQRAAPIGRIVPILTHPRNRSGDEKYRVEIPG